MIPLLHRTYLDLNRAAYTPGFLDSPGKLDVSALGYDLTDIIYGVDVDGVQTPYGYLAASLGTLPNTDPKDTVIGVYRGTEWDQPNSKYKSPAEWIADLMALLVAAERFAAGAEVHAGFFDLYGTMTIGNTTTAMTIVKAFASFTGRLIWEGHSLGKPLATQSAGDTKATALVGWSGPKTGNGKFAAWLRNQVQEYVDLYANVRDIVPHGPFTLPPFEEFQHVDVLTPYNSDDLGPVPSIYDWKTKWSYFHSLDTARACLFPAAA